MRVALINYIIAKQQGEGFILRVEDIDKSHNIEGKDTEVKQLLEKFAVHHDQLVYQSEGLHRYQQLAVSLVELDKAFVCTCTAEELEADRGRARLEKIPYQYSGRCFNNSTEALKLIKEKNLPYLIRIKLPEASIEFVDQVKGEVATPPNEVDSFVILRADGNPTSTFSYAVDDMLGGITTVIRGEDYLSDTPKQIHIRSQLGYEDLIKHAHVPVILSINGKKMSEQDDANSIKWLLGQGFLPDAIINYLLLLGNKTPMEVFTLPEAIEWFSLGTISKSPAKFDLDKLRLLNREHLRKMDDKALSSMYGFADAQIGRLVKLYLGEASTIRELDIKIKPIFAPKPCSGKWGQQMHIISDLIANAPVFDSFDELKNFITERSGLENENLFKPIRLLLTGAEHGPELTDLYPLIKSYILEVARCPR
jgi:glutamyl-tRNA synthetase